jgi:hypothetical protein
MHNPTGTPTPPFRGHVLIGGIVCITHFVKLVMVVSPPSFLDIGTRPNLTP